MARIRPAKTSLPPLPTGASAEERRAHAAALQASLVEGFQSKAAAKGPRPTVPGARVVEGLTTAVREILSGLALHGRRYGLTHTARAALRKMGCRTLADVADTPVQRCVDWLGYREAEVVGGRLAAIVAEAEAGHPEPGVSRMAVALDDETRSWLAGRPVEDVAGRGIPRRVAEALRAAGHETLAALASEESDAVEDVHGIGAATVAALKLRLAGLVAEGAEAPSRKRRRRLSVEDAEWDAAAPTPDEGI